MSPAPARHAELVSASSPPPPGRETGWTLKQVQGDDLSPYLEAQKLPAIGLEGSVG
jgi:hypothetical protein